MLFPEEIFRYIIDYIASPYKRPLHINAVTTDRIFMLYQVHAAYHTHRSSYRQAVSFFQYKRFLLSNPFYYEK